MSSLTAMNCLTVLFSFLFINPKSNHNNEARAATGAAPELKVAYGEINDLGRQMTDVAKHLKSAVNKHSNPEQWDERSVVDFYGALSDDISKINSMDKNARKALATFEKELAKSNLPQSALERHREFVAQYEKNYEKLTSLYNAISGRRGDLLKNRNSGVIPKDKYDRDSKARADIRANINELKEFLDKWDVDGKEPPKNEGPDAPKPWQNVFAKERAPRTGGKETPAYLSAKRNANTAPADADLAQTMDTESVAEILTLTTIDPALKAAVDNHDAIAIYEWVLNNIYYQPYYGSAKGAAKTYYDRAGNDFDTASLLIGLYRTAGIPCRYVYGTVKITAEQANNMFGTDSAVVAATIIARGGTPATWDGFDLLIEHCYVEVYVPYDIYRGTAELPGGETWIPLDPSFKTYSYNMGMDVAKDVPFDLKSFFENGVTQKTAVDIYKDAIAEYVEANYPDKTVDDVPIKRTIVPENLRILPLSLPYEVESVHTEYSEIRDELRHKVRFKALSSEADMPFDAVTTFNVTLESVKIYSKRLTLEWIGSDIEDQSIIDYWGGLFTTPLYFIKGIKPVLMLNGEIRATGDTYNFDGNLRWLRYYAILPDGVEIDGTGNEYGHVFEITKHPFAVGETVGVGIDFQGYSDEYMRRQFDILQANKNSLNYDDVFGQIAYINIICWYNTMNKAGEMAYGLTHTSFYTCRSAYSVGKIINTTNILMGGGVIGTIPIGFITSGGPPGWSMWDLHANSAGDNLYYAFGCTMSQLEGFTYRDLYGMPPVSAVTIIQYAYQTDFPVINYLTDNDSGTDGIYVNGNLDYYDWSGTAWICATGIGSDCGYLISGGWHGGSSGVTLGARFIPRDKEIYLRSDDINATAEANIYSINPANVFTDSNYSTTVNATLKRCSANQQDCSTYSEEEAFLQNNIIYPVQDSNHTNDYTKTYFLIGKELSRIYPQPDDRIRGYLLKARYTVSSTLEAMVMMQGNNNLG